MTPNPAPAPRKGRSAQMPPAIARLAVCFIAATFFFTIATFNKPRSSNADSARFQPASANSPTRAAQAPSTNAVTAPAIDPQGHKLIGSLTGRGVHVWIYSSPDGPLYTVLNDQGAIQGTAMTTDQVYERFPDLNIHEMHFSGDPKQLMLVDPRN